MSSKNWTQKTAKVGTSILEIALPLVFGTIYGLVVHYSPIKPSTINVDSVLALWLLMLFLTPFMFIQGVIFVLSQMVADRESKMRETLKIMGLGRVAYGISYMVMQGLLALLASVIVMIALYWPIRG
jgi:hypothetical protein